MSSYNLAPIAAAEAAYFEVAFKEGNIIPGSGPNFVLEADEYDCCFLGLSPSVAVVTSVEWDHVDIFHDEEAVLDTFRKFLQKVKIGGHLIICGDSAGAYSLVSKSIKERVSDCEMVLTSLASKPGYSITTYGISSKNDWHASSVTPNSHGGQDYVLYHNNCPIGNVSLVLPGVHNVLNSLAVIATVALLVSDQKKLNATISSVAYHLSTFTGVSRRFELVGSLNKCHIYDDYAHHPTEVRAALQAARQLFPYQALWIVFQPHTFSRLAALMKDFATAFVDADHLIITEVYASREMNGCSCDGRELASSIRGPSCEYIPKMEDVIEKLVYEISSDINQEIVVLTLGAGDITTLGPELLKRLREKL
ncbi:uncharacterized protein A4U43_C01F16260 [Asparagus officinalis]|uniref:UDP-N-acetylmuramate--L-alanine ligase n=1 Tax=Asparagus officinalis TaxID=4686 RepID=A0A5P1FUC5_ASPOF|nr:uncharacterized protein A4U43_C01F16260 [Asparagus officinalis]